MKLLPDTKKTKDHYTGLITDMVMGWTVCPPIIYLVASVLTTTVALNATTCSDEQMSLICGPTPEVP